MAKIYIDTYNSWFLFKHYMIIYRIDSYAGSNYWYHVVIDEVNWKNLSIL